MGRSFALKRRDGRDQRWQGAGNKEKEDQTNFCYCISREAEGKGLPSKCHQIMNAISLPLLRCQSDAWGEKAGILLRNDSMVESSPPSLSNLHTSILLLTGIINI
jgi:hypothetical protein